MTNEEINAITDPQINVMMTANLNHIADYIIGESGNCIYTSSEYGMHVIDVKDYCNDPAVMMPIMISNNIAMLKKHYLDEWDVEVTIVDCDGSTHHYHSHENPLRAAAIVYLKMKGVL